MRLLNQTQNGSLLYCSTCERFHVIFGNIHYEFIPKELQSFQDFIIGIDATYWEKKYCSCLVRRKIPIPTSQQNLCLMLNRKELEEIKKLISQTQPQDGISTINTEDIDYNFIPN